MNSKTMKQYVIDAFTDHVFAGNPAAVCVMDAWLPEDTMMASRSVDAMRVLNLTSFFMSCPPNRR